MASNIPVIVQGNSFNLAIPLQIYVINGDQMELQDYTPDPTDQISIQLKGSRRNYTYTPTSVTDNVCMIALGGYELADNYSVVVSIVKANGQRLRSFRTDQFFIVESSDDLTQDDIIQGLEENVIYLNSSIFVAGADGRGIESIIKTGTSGLVDTYTITYSDETTSTFNVTNGAPGADGQQGEDGVGITSIEKTATAGLVDTYTITYSDETTSTFNVTNGKDGVDLGLATIINDLTTGGATNVLSAEQGKVLRSMHYPDSKNLFDVSGWVENFYLNGATGSTNNKYDTTGYINVEYGKSYVYSALGSVISTQLAVVTEWDANKGYLGKSTVDKSTGLITLNDSAVAFIRISLYQPTVTSALYGSITRARLKWYIQVEEGSTITLPVLYGESDAISKQVTAETLSYYDVDKNMLDYLNSEIGSINVNTGEDEDNSGRLRFPPFYVDASMVTELYVTFNGNLSSSYLVTLAYNEDGFMCQLTNKDGRVFVPPATTYLRFYQTNKNMYVSVVCASAAKYPLLTNHEKAEPTIMGKYLPIKSRYEGKTVAFLGDSFTSMMVYLPLCAALLNLGKTYNWGENGQMLKTYTTRLGTYLGNVDISTLDLIVVEGGTNDFSANYGVDGSNGVGTSAQAVISYLLNLRADLDIIFVTPTYRNGYTSPGSSTPSTDTDSGGHHISEYASAIRAKCEANGIPVYDAYQNIGINQYNVASTTRDGLHPTDEKFRIYGYQLAQAIARM